MAAPDALMIKDIRNKRDMKKIEILGPGCPKCQKLEQQTRAAVAELGLGCQVEKVTVEEKDGG